jgi:RepB DNA-primase from phage plasmid
MNNVDFLSAMFEGMADGEMTTLHSFMGDPSQYAEGKWFGYPWKRGMRLPVKAGNPFANNYVCVSTFHPDSEGKVYRRKMLFAGLYAVMIDDLGTKLPMADLRMEPSALIETSPGNFQAWLFLAAPIRDAALADRLIEQMVERGISAEMDPGMKGITRVARLPVGVNRKAKYGEHGFKHVVHKFDPAIKYTHREIADCYGLSLAVQTREPPKPPRNGIDPERANLAHWLGLLGLLGRELRDGYYELECPWADAHSDRGKTGTYFVTPGEGNSYRAGFICHHGHCSERDINDLIGFVRARKDELKTTAVVNSTKKRGRRTATAGAGATKTVRSTTPDTAKPQDKPKRRGKPVS